MEGGGHQLGHHIGFSIRKVQRTANIPDSATGCHCAKSSDLRHSIRTILTHHIVNDFATAFLAEVRIEVGHTDTLGVQESLENQCVLHGIYFRNVHTVRHNGSRAGATARSNGNAGFLGIADKVPNDEVVVHIPHSTDNADLILQPLHIVGRRIGIAFPEAIHTQLAEIFFIGVALRYRERGQMVLIEYEFQVTPIGDPAGIFESLRHMGEQLAQLLLALEVEFLGLEFHTVFVIHGFAGLYTQQNILHRRILTAQVVGIVCDHQRHTGLPGESQHALIYRLLLPDTMILEFQIEIALSKDAFHLQSIGPGIVVRFVQQILLHTAG